MRTPLPYYGAKVSMAKRIVRELPEKHEVYLEPFCGSAAVFFEKPPAEAVEILSDMNPWCLAALRAVRDSPWSFHDALPDEIEHDHWRNSVIAVRNNRITGSDIEDGVNMFLAWQSAFNSSPWSGARSKRACQQYADSRVERSGLAADRGGVRAPECRFGHSGGANRRHFRHTARGRARRSDLLRSALHEDGRRRRQPRCGLRRLRTVGAGYVVAPGVSGRH